MTIKKLFTRRHNTIDGITDNYFYGKRRFLTGISSIYPN
jgi:hypothetical protein